MPFELIDGDLPDARPVHLVSAGLDRTGLPPAVVEWARANGYSGEAGKLLAYPDDRGRLAGVLYGLPREADGFAPLAIGGLARALPPGGRLVTIEQDPRHAAFAREWLARLGLAFADTLSRGFGPCLGTRDRRFDTCGQLFVEVRALRLRRGDGFADLMLR